MSFENLKLLRILPDSFLFFSLYKIKKKAEDYYLAELTHIIFSYKIIPSQKLESKILQSDGSGLPTITDKDSNKSDIATFFPAEGTKSDPEGRNRISKTSFGGVNLPNTMDIKL